MAEAWLLVVSFLCAFAGMSWLALAMKPHWVQVLGGVPHDEPLARRLRCIGAACLMLSLALCLAQSHASMAFLVWLMTLSATALLVAMALAYAPRSLAWLAMIAAGLRGSARPTRPGRRY